MNAVMQITPDMLVNT